MIALEGVAERRQHLPKARRALLLLPAAPELVLQPASRSPQARRDPEQRQQTAPLGGPQRDLGSIRPQLSQGSEEPQH
jgi:hypothetical protein